MLEHLFKQMRSLMEDSRQQLEELTIESEQGGVKITCNGNRVIKDIQLPQEMLSTVHREELEDLIVAVTNDALRKADHASSEALKNMAGGIIPGGLDGLF